MGDVTKDIIYPRSATIVAAACAVIFCCVGVIGNLVTIFALSRCPKLRAHATTFFVLSLCASDLLFCLINLPLTASRYIHQRWNFGDGLCQAFPVLLYGNVALSLLNMVAITVNRYVIIACYEHYKKLYSTISIWIQLISIWAISFLIMLPPLLGVWGELGLDEETFSCTIKRKDDRSPKKFIFLVGFVLPCVVIIASYTSIYVKVTSAKNNLKQHATQGTIDRKSRRERDDRRLTKLMVVIFVCFVLCFLPLMCMNVFDEHVTVPWLHIFASILAWASSVINPIIYAASNRQYRTAYAKLFNLVKTSVTVSDSRQLSNSNGGRSRTADNNRCVIQNNSVNIYTKV